MILFLKDNGGEFWVDLIYNFAYEWSQVGPGVDRESYDIFTYQRKNVLWQGWNEKYPWGVENDCHYECHQEEQDPVALQNRVIKGSAMLAWQDVCHLPSFLDIWEDWGLVSFAKVICQLMREAGILSISLFPFLPRGCLVTCDLHCMFWEPFHWSLRIFRICPSIWFCIFSSGTFSYFFIKLVFLPSTYCLFLCHPSDCYDGF